MESNPSSVPHSSGHQNESSQIIASAWLPLVAWLILPLACSVATLFMCSTLTATLSRGLTEDQIFQRLDMGRGAIALLMQMLFAWAATALLDRRAFENKALSFTLSAYSLTMLFNWFLLKTMHAEGWAASTRRGLEYAISPDFALANVFVSGVGIAFILWRRKIALVDKEELKRVLLVALIYGLLICKIVTI